MTCNGLQRALIVLALCASSIAAQAQPQDSYTLTLIGTAIPNDPVGWFAVEDLNVRGEIVGARPTPDGTTLAFMWRDGVFQELNPLVPADAAFASAINDTSVILGSYSDQQLGQHNFLLRRERVTTIEDPDNRTAGALEMNNRSQALFRATNDEAGFLWQRGRFSPLEPLPGSQSTSASHLNDWGLVLGTAHFADHSVPVIWWGRTVMELDRPVGSQFVSGTSLNDLGSVLVDASFPAPIPHTRAVLWVLGRYFELAPLAGETSSSATDVNNRNVVVGRSSDLLATHMTATLWDRARAIDLNTRVRSDDPLAPFVHLQWGLLINDRGLIVARGVDSRDTDRRFGFYLLKPR